jgi:hypothetical protein
MEENEIKPVESFEVEELDERDLSDAAGGNRDAEIGTEPSNTNCGCNGNTFQGVAGSSNSNCGC